MLPLMNTPNRGSAVLLSVMLLVRIVSAGTVSDGEWQHYGNTLAGTRYSPLDQITSANVSSLERAWIYRSGVADSGATHKVEVTPLMVGNSLYLCTQTNIVISLDPETGHERWRFDPKVDALGETPATACRGVAYFRAPASPNECPERILTSTFDARLIAIDAKTGQLCRSFGDGGTVNLKNGLGAIEPGISAPSSAPTIVRGNVILGGWVSDNLYVDEPSGVIRAYDATNGRFVWAWDIGRPGQHGEPVSGQSYTLGTPNSWAPMSGDEDLGLVFLPMGNSTPDHWGAHRSKLSEQYASSIVALDVETGEPRWSFQTTHHDLWDYDVASQPTLINLRIGDRMVPALIQLTKRGEIFVLDRRSGRPITEVEEKRVPQGAAPGDWTAPTQPFSTGMPSFGGPNLTEKDMWGVTPLDQLYCRIMFRRLRYDGPNTPPGLTGTLVYPGTAGGFNWGSASVDPERGLLVINSIRIPTLIRLIPSAAAAAISEADRVDMFRQRVIYPQSGTPFAAEVRTFLSPLNIPCNRPPFGLLSAVDLNTRKLLWSTPLGTGRDYGPMGISSGLPIPMGVPNLGGSVTTHSGLVFIGATQERAFRAFDVRTGHELWRDRLPAGGQATPMTYISPLSGRQFVVIAAGGSALLQSKLGDYIVAYALPHSPAQ
jgi:quinoprotein glucose dehydrogenase